MSEARNMRTGIDNPEPEKEVEFPRPGLDQTDLMEGIKAGIHSLRNAASGLTGEERIDVLSSIGRQLESIARYAKAMIKDTKDEFGFVLNEWQHEQQEKAENKKGRRKPQRNFSIEEEEEDEDD